MVFKLQVASVGLVDADKKEWLNHLFGDFLRLVLIFLVLSLLVSVSDNESGIVDNTRIHTCLAAAKLTALPEAVVPVHSDGAFVDFEAVDPIHRLLRVIVCVVLNEAESTRSVLLRV